MGVVPDIPSIFLKLSIVNLTNFLPKVFNFTRFFFLQRNFFFFSILKLSVDSQIKFLHFKTKIIFDFFLLTLRTVWNTHETIKVF